MCSLPFSASADEEIDNQCVVIQNTFVNVVDAASMATRSSLRQIQSDSCLLRQGRACSTRTLSECTVISSKIDDSDLSTEASAGESQLDEEDEDSQPEGLGEPGEEVSPERMRTRTHSFWQGQEDTTVAQENAALPETYCGFVPVYFTGCFQQPAPEEAFPQFDSMTACNLKDTRTTLMIRNLPNDYTQAMVLELLESKGFGSNTYNFFYLPIDFQTRVALGYAFIDLAHPSLVQPFWEVLDGFSDWVVRSGKVCWVSWCEPSQGLETHIERYRNSPVMHDSVPDEHKPLLLENGCRIPFPKPTKSIRAPRLRPCRRQQ